MIKNAKSYIILSDETSLAKYKEYYFKKYPNRKTFLIDSPLHPSMNKWVRLQGFKQNALKQAWKEYVMWLVEEHGYTNLMVEKCRCEARFYRPTKRRYDLDNLSLKFFLDGVVESNMIIDDSIEYLNPLVLWGSYDKEHPRMEIEFIVEE